MERANSDLAISIIMMIFFIAATAFSCGFVPGEDLWQVSNSEVVELEIDKLSQGQILLNLAEEMKVNKEVVVEARISKTKTNRQGLAEGLPQEKTTQMMETKVGTFMEVCLRGESFDIQPVTHEEQIIPDEGFTKWVWNVVPKETGYHPLFLVVTVRIKTPDGAEEKLDLLVLEKLICVNGSVVAIREIVRDPTFQWAVSIVVGISIAIIGWTARKYRNSRKRKKRGAPSAPSKMTIAALVATMVVSLTVFGILSVDTTQICVHEKVEGAENSAFIAIHHSESDGILSIQLWYMVAPLEHINREDFIWYLDGECMGPPDSVTCSNDGSGLLKSGGIVTVCLRIEGNQQNGTIIIIFRDAHAIIISL